MNTGLINDRWVNIPASAIFEQLTPLWIRTWGVTTLEDGGYPRHYLTSPDYAYPYSLPLEMAISIGKRLNKGVKVAFDYEARIRKFEEHYETYGEAFHNASAFGITIDPPEENPDNPTWLVLGIYHLTGEENRGNHNIFVRATCDTGNHDGMQAISWDWDQRHNEPKPGPVFGASKQPPDLPDIPIFGGVNMLVWVEGGEVVTGINAARASNEQGNDFGHHSFFICFRKVGDAFPPSFPDPPPPVEPPIDPPATGLKRQVPPEIIEVAWTSETEITVTVKVIDD